VPKQMSVKPIMKLIMGSGKMPIYMNMAPNIIMSTIKIVLNTVLELTPLFKISSSSSSGSIIENRKNRNI
jgi:hypothetical protein